MEKSPVTLSGITKPRVEYIDLLKAFGIFCVIWFHAVEVFNNAIMIPTNEHYFETDPLHTFIATFNMPLFFMISGFFFSSSFNLSFKEVLRKRFTVLIIPHIAWVIILAFSDWGMTFLGWSRTTPRPFSILGQLEAFLMPEPRADLWFFRELFVTDMIVFIFCKIFKKRYAAFIASMLFVILFNCFGVVTRMQRFMLPIFWAGILLRTYHPFFTKHLNKLLIGIGVLFVVCLYFFDHPYVIYASTFPPIINFQQSFAEGSIVFDDIANIRISVIRFLTGATGSVFFFAVFQRFWRKNKVTSFLCRCGQITLGIYGIQAILLQRILGNLLDFSNINIWIYRLVITPIAAVFVLLACTLITMLIQKNKSLTFVLFGSSVVERRGVHSDDKEALAAHVAEARVAEARSAEALALATEARALEALAAEARTAEARVAEARALESRALAARVAEARSAEARAAEVRSAEARAAEARSLEALEVRALTTRSLEARALEALVAETRSTEVRALEDRAS
jgi:fucose 4-O-acetylase-like acetyltransferase